MRIAQRLGNLPVLRLVHGQLDRAPQRGAEHLAGNHGVHIADANLAAGVDQDQLVIIQPAIAIEPKQRPPLALVFAKSQEVIAAARPGRLHDACADLQPALDVHQGGRPGGAVLIAGDDRFLEVGQIEVGVEGRAVALGDGILKLIGELLLGRGGRLGGHSPQASKQQWHGEPEEHAMAIVSPAAGQVKHRFAPPPSFLYTPSPTRTDWSVFIAFLPMRAIVVNRALPLLLSAAILAASFSGCIRRKQESLVKGPPVIPVTTAPLRLAPIQRSVEFVGTLWGDEDAIVASKISGRITAICGDVGDRVASDEPLAQVAPIDYELARLQKQLAVREPLAKLGLEKVPDESFDVAGVPSVVRAKLQADNAESKYNRGKSLHEQKLLSDQDYSDLLMAWEVAQTNRQVELLTAQALLAQARSLEADLAIAEQRLADATIRAPATQPTPGSRGEVPRRHNYAIAARMITVGEYVKDGTPAFRLIDDDQLKLRAAVPERYLREIRQEQIVRLTVDAYAQEFEGRVWRINPQVDPASRTFQIEVLVPNGQHLLKSGSFVRGRVLTRWDESAVFVPQDAIITFAGVSKIFITRSDKASERTIDTGETRSFAVQLPAAMFLRPPMTMAGPGGIDALSLCLALSVRGVTADVAGNYVEARTGLEGNETVIIEGISRLAEGMAIRRK